MENKINVLECAECTKKFSKKINLQNHIRRVHKASGYECFYCGNCFKRRESIIRHIYKLHTGAEDVKEKSESIKNGFKCRTCDLVYSTKDRILNHYKKIHAITLETENFRFKSFEEFKEWKSDIQRQSVIRFTARNVWYTMSATNRLFRCHRSGAYSEKLDKKCPVKFPKFNGTKKLQAYCPAEITVKIEKENGSCYVNYVKTHVGHCIGDLSELRHIKLNKTEIMEIALETDMSAPSDAITESESSSTLSHLALSTSKDVHNVTSSYGVRHGKLFPLEDDELNVDVFSCSRQNDILYFKNRMEDDTKFNVLQKNDFVLIFMNEWQEENLKRFGNKVVAFDGAYEINESHFAIHTLLVYDIDRKGVPAAFLLTNRNDQDVINIFVRCIRDRVGILKPKTITTDARPSYFDSWISVMENVPQFRLYCTWHVHKAWRRNLSLVSDTAKRKAVYKELIDMSQELNPVQFEEKLETFLSNRGHSVQKFLNYFRRNYAENVHNWAYCYRKNAGINVNLTMASFYHSLKCNMAESEMHWVSYTICYLEKYVEVQRKREELRRIRGRPCHKLVMLRAKHHDAYKHLKGNPNIVIEIDGGAWLVNSFENPDSIYLVTKTNENKECSLYETADCRLPCHLCGTCYHEYVCDCLDAAIRGNMCKHIHSVGIYLKENREIPVLTADTASNSPDPSIADIFILPSDCVSVHCAEEEQRDEKKFILPDDSKNSIELFDSDSEDKLIDSMEWKMLNTVKHTISIVRANNKSNPVADLVELDRSFLQPMRLTVESKYSE